MRVDQQRDKEMQGKTTKIGEIEIPIQNVGSVTATMPRKLSIKGQDVGGSLIIDCLKKLPAGVAYSVVAQDTTTGRNCSGIYELRHCDFKQSTSTAGSIVIAFTCELEKIKER